jgi:hypothetical protein
VGLCVRKLITETELEAELAEIRRQHEHTEQRLAAFSEPDDGEDPWIAPDLLADLRQRLDAGFDAQTRQEICRLLVKRIVVHTTTDERGKKSASLTVTYRFPGQTTIGVAPDCTDTDS